MKRTLFLLVLYCSMSIIAGKNLRSFCAEMFSTCNLSAKTFLLDLSDAENETETDSEDTEENGTEGIDAHEITSNLFCSPFLTAKKNYFSTTSFLKDHPQEIGTPPPRF